MYALLPPGAHLVRLFGLVDRVRLVGKAAKARSETAYNAV